VRVRRDEGVANRIGPESCAGIRESCGEASIGDCTGQPLSRERSHIPGADAVQRAEGDTGGRASASVRTARVVEDPGMCRRSLRGNREASCRPKRSASGRRGAVADGERVRGV
jgi:hypothetical protein